MSALAIERDIPLIDPCPDLSAKCGKCARETDHYAPSGQAYCAQCWALLHDPREPLPGVLCPACHFGQTYAISRLQHPGAWVCTRCYAPYALACKVADRPTHFPAQQQLTTITTDHHRSPRSTTPKEIAMPAPLNLSHSQLESWEHCPQKWAFNKIDKLQQAPAEALILGTAFHAALEEDGRRKLRGERPMEDFELFAWFNEHLIAGLKAEDPTDLLKRQHQAMRAKAQLMIRAYVAQVQPHFQPLAVEQDFTYAVGENVTMRGRIDAITGASIVDWKTASKPWQPDAQHGKDQAAAYLIAQPAAQRVSFAVFAPDVQRDTCSFQSLATTRTDAQQQEYRHKVLTIASEIRAAKAAGEYKANPGPLCGWCGYVGSCPIGETWLKTRGKVPAVPVLREKMADAVTEVEA